MRKTILTLWTLLLLTAAAHAQSPNGVNYQLVVRDGSGNVLSSRAVSIRFALRQGTAAGTVVFAENHSATSSSLGLVNLVLGNGTATTGSMASVNWAAGPYFLETLIDQNGGSSYTPMGTQQLMSVPYALFANTALNGVPAGGSSGQVLTNCNGIAVWTTGGQCPGTISALNCGSASNSGTLTAGTAASGVSSSVPYTGGNGGTYSAQSVSSTGVTGLTASLAAGTLASGSGSLNYTITGTPGAAGTASFTLSIGGQTCTLTRTVNLPAGTITALNCGSATNSGTLTSGTAASGVSSIIPYTGGNGGTYSAQSVSSTGVTGLTASLAAGTLASGSGSLNYTITGTPTAAGTASFTLSIGGQTCTLSRTVNAAGSGQYPTGSVFCNGPTAMVDVTNPATGKIWMDRNLGASRAATSSTDANAYGDLYQWGRRSDGHQCRNSDTTSTLSSSDQPAHGSFIRALNSPLDWRSPQNTNLWQGVNGVNNPCPIAYRLPTEVELEAERTSWSSSDSAGAFASPLKLPMAGLRDFFGLVYDAGRFGFYWSSTVFGSSARLLIFRNTAYMDYDFRAFGFSVRCLKD